MKAKDYIKWLGSKEKNINWKNKFNTLCDELEQRPIEKITDKRKQELMFIFGIRAVEGGRYGEGFFDALNYIKFKIDSKGEVYLLKIWKSIEAKQKENKDNGNIQYYM